MVEFNVLGPVEVWHEGTSLRFSRRQQRLIVGILALQANNVVSRERLIDLLWTDQPPPQARAVVHSRVSEIRGVLADALDCHPDVQLLTRGNAYLLEVPPELVDVHRFRTSAARWRNAESDDEARKILRQALGLWRGPVLGGGLSEETYAALAQGSEAARLTAAEDLFDVELRLANHVQVVDEITELAAANPTRERLAAQMMLAMHRSGRTADALLAYDRYRRWLSDHLGVDPGQDIQSLYMAMLDNESALLVHPSPVPGPAAGQVTDLAAGGAELLPADSGERFHISVPRILPPGIADFTGRDTELAEARNLLTSPRRTGSPILAITGQAGIGKTAFTIKVAHEVREHFPDGQLYMDLRGFDSSDPASPHEALGRFLRVLGVDGDAVPSSLEDRIDLYRDLLDSRKVLVVLDNARSDDQVAPLVPGGDACGVLVSSRARLGSTLGAKVMNLDVLDPAQSLALLSRIAGPSRIASEAGETEALISQCGQLPLALRIVGAKLAAKPHWSVARLVALLNDGQRQLDLLSHEHLDVRASIALSYEGLRPDVQRLLRGLGDMDSAEVTVWASSALLGVRSEVAEDLLEELFDAQLVGVAGCDATGHARYRIHDLVRAFALERAAVEDDLRTLEEGRIRVLGAWLHVATAAYRSIQGGDYQNIRSDAPRWPVEDVLVNALVAEPFRWIEVERQTLVALARRAASDGHATACWELASTLTPLLHMRRHYDEWQAILRSALDAVSRAGDNRGRAALLYRSGMIHTDHQEFDQAWAAFQEAAAIFEEAGDRHGWATATVFTAMVDRQRGESDTALSRYESTLPILRDSGDMGGLAFALRSIGQIHLSRQEYELADDHFGQAKTLYQEAGSEYGLATAEFWQGMLRVRQEVAGEALTLFERVLNRCRKLGDRPGQAQSLRGLGIWHRRFGDSQQGMALLQEALSIIKQPRPTVLEAHIRQTIADFSQPQ
ncbi:AfsR/SARP family transcriptional regulator [Longispora albida]|uniref:AfsR/SARP family transcriptional regulator n=1 Tax=Longispora albida TaxID=203523 RepID=UPI00039D02D4|nr:AfsR/SARP family transcriptional regulator [Longispora albida]